MTVARHMRIRYMWIDSMCIIQEDPDDWNREGGKMFQVYKNSFVTFAAWSKDPNQGLFNDINGRHEFRSSWGRPRVAELQYNGQRWPVYVQRLHNDLMKEHRSCAVGFGIPLMIRAWTLQERLISARVLFFGPSEVSFECFCQNSCHCGGTVSRDLKGQSFNTISRIQQERTTNPKQIISFDSYEGGKFDWREVVREFCSMKLSYEKDRLPAIGALAVVWQRVYPDEKYLAGLWSGSLIEDLLWTSNSISCGRSPPNTGYPTWTWAHLRDHVPTWPGTYSHGIFDNIATVVEASCGYVDNNAFGVLDKSRLVLAGPMLPGYAWQSSGSKPSHLDKPKFLFLKHAFAFMKGSQHYLLYPSIGGHLVLETDIVFSKGFTRIYLLNMGRKRNCSSTVILQYYMVLTPTDHSETAFSRVGVMSTSCSLFNKAFFKHGINQKCVII